MAANNTLVQLPDSAVSALTGVLGLAGLTLSLAGLVLYEPNVGATPRAVLVCLATAVPMAAMRLLVLLRESPGRTSQRPIAWRRVAVKLLGLYSVYALIALGYWLFPEYGGSFYDSYYFVLFRVWPGLAVLAIPYFFWLDGRMDNPVDGCWHAGMAVLGQWSQGSTEALGQLIRGWLIKAYFLPLMFIYTVDSIGNIVYGIESGALFDAHRWYDFSYHLIFMVDLVFACIGYSLALRLFDNHIRSAEPTMLGWTVALVCYQPLWNLIGGQYLAYNPDGSGWGARLSGLLLADIWPIVILVLLGFYVWATITFGLRFSNLTHRGILTNGPYRFTKHPAYIAKNISWWLISVPFIVSGSVFDAVRNCMLLLMLNTIYYLRARTEERHLSQDPVYVQYALWIEQNGWFRWTGRLWPRAFAFRWREPDQARLAMGLTRFFGRAANNPQAQ